MTKSWRGILLAVALFAAGALSATEHSIHITLEASSLSLSDITPSGRVALFAMSMRQERGMPTLRRFEKVLTDDDGDGSIVFQPGGGVPLRSVWLAVDLTNGSLASASPAGTELNPRAIGSDELVRNAQSAAVALRQERLSVDLLLVRPGTGAWILRAREGGSMDGDHTRNGMLTVTFADAEALDTGSGSAPAQLQPGDVVAAIDPSQFDLLTLTAQ